MPLVEPIPLILASSSKSRLDLLRTIGLTPQQVISPDIIETPLKKELPRVYNQRLAREKFAKATTMINQPAIVITADTVAACGRRIMDKSYDDKVISEYLQLLSGRRHKVYTSVCCGYVENGQVIKMLSKTSTSIVSLKRLHPQEIQFILNSGESEGKAGGI